MLALLVGALVAAMILVREAPPPPSQPQPQAKAAEELVVVLPGRDGTTGSVVVERDGARQILDRPYAASRIRGDGGPQAGESSDQDVRLAFGDTLAALPARPASFLLYFVTGRDELTPASKDELQKVLAELRGRPVPDVVVIGHTDTVGSAGANDALSLQRAERVKGFLAAIGIASERIRTAGRGERELAVPTADNVEEPRNRRVEISVR